MTLLVTSFLAQAFLVIVPVAILLIAWLAFQDRLGGRLDLRDLELLWVAAGVLGWLFVPGALGRERSVFDLIAALVLLAVLIRLAHPLLRYLEGRPPAATPSQRQVGPTRSSPSSAQEDVAYDRLLGMVAGDKRSAENLIRFEQTRAPGATYGELIERAIERLARDRQ